MLILGLDQAPSNIGFAYGEPGAVPVWGVHRCNDYGDNTARLGKHVREWVMTLGKSIGAERIYYEQTLVRKFGFSMPTYRKQTKVADAIETAADMLGLLDDVFEVDIGDWRREFYAGKRPPKNADSQSAVWKEIAVQECLARNWLVEDHHAAEACGIWYYGCVHSDKRFRVQHKVTMRRAELKAMQAEAV